MKLSDEKSAEYRDIEVIFTQFMDVDPEVVNIKEGGGAKNRTETEESGEDTN